MKGDRSSLPFRMAMIPLPSRIRMLLLSALILVAGSACSSAETTETTAPAPRTPTEVVTALLAAIDEGRFEDTAALTVPDHPALFTLAEGATPSDVAGSMDEEGEAVAANFWSGFAQSLTDGFGQDESSIELDEEVTEGSTRFAIVDVVDADGTRRSFVLRMVEDEWRIDLFASFSRIVAGELIPGVESVLGSANADAAIVLGGLADTADSLRMAAADPDLSTDDHQAILSLLERVTRAG